MPAEYLDMRCSGNRNAEFPALLSSFSFFIVADYINIGRSVLSPTPDLVFTKVGTGI